MDPDAIALSPTTTVSVALAEYGRALLRTRALELFSLSDIKQATANIIAYDMANSLDLDVSTVLTGTTNMVYEAAGALDYSSTGTNATI